MVWEKEDILSYEGTQNYTKVFSKLNYLVLFFKLICISIYSTRKQKTDVAQKQSSACCFF